MSGEVDWLDYVQKLGPALSAIASSGAAIIALCVAFKGRKTAERDQAECITAWLDGEATIGGELKHVVRLGNASQQVAYDIVVRLVRVPNRPDAEPIPEVTDRDVAATAYIRALAPGERTVNMNYADSGMHKRYGVEFGVQDAAGNYWFRSATGRLTKIKTHPVDYFKMSWPVGWGS